MTVDSASARCVCDRCGKWYIVQLDPAFDCSPYDQATDQWVEVLDYQDHKPGACPMIGHTTASATMLCPPCVTALKLFDTAPPLVKQAARPRLTLVKGGDNGSI